jgi:transposase
MAKARSVVGLDVHASKIVAVLYADTGELQFFEMNGEIRAAAGLCAGLPRPVKVAYEAGPTGYGLARELAKRRVECVVAAPSKIPRATGDKVKTDRRDAEQLVRLLLAGKLHPVRVPGPEEEALRDLVRARETLRLDLMRARHRLSKLLLRRGIQFDNGHAWTERHRAWLKTVSLEWPGVDRPHGNLGTGPCPESCPRDPAARHVALPRGADARRHRRRPLGHRGRLSVSSIRCSCSGRRRNPAKRAGEPVGELACWPGM